MITKIKKDASEAAEKKTDVRIDLLKQEFTASQQKFQDDIARLAAEAKEALAAKEAAEKKLASLQSHQGTGDAGSPSGSVQLKRSLFFEKLFRKAWQDGVISPDELGLLTIVKTEGGVSDEDFTKIENETCASSYLTHLREVWKDGARNARRSRKA